MGFFERILKKETVKPEIYATQNGVVINITALDDPVFSQKIIGDGFAVEPSDEIVYSPVSGTVVDVQDSLHAYAIESADGLEVLVHIGINTVALNGEGFEAYVKKGNKVKVGDKLAKVDTELIKSKGYPTTTVVLITNMDDVNAIDVKYGSCAAGTAVLTYEK